MQRQQLPSDVDRRQHPAGGDFHSPMAAWILRPMPSSNAEPASLSIYTIGHSSHAWPAFVDLLTAHRISAIADVRSAPYSRRYPQFNRETMQPALADRGIAYVFLGRELGARSEDPDCYVDGRVQYARLARTTSFNTGITRVIDGAASFRIALMCAEREPLDCHRTLLVGRALAARGVGVSHILADGTVESHEATLRRLPDLLAMPTADLFESENDRLESACAQQERRIAYVDEAMRKPR
jgi:uncharacterized protein (DUF488 family)